MSAPFKKEVLTRSSAGEPELYECQTLSRGINPEEIIQLRKNKFLITLGRVGVKCTGSCGPKCQLSSIAKRWITDFDNIEPMLDNDGQIVDKLFEAEAFDSCDKLSAKGILDARNPEKVTIRPKEEYIKQQQEALYVHATVVSGDTEPVSA